MLEFLGIIALIFGFNLVLRLFVKGARVATEGVKSAVTGQDFDMDRALGRIPPIAARLTKKNTEDDGSGLDYYAVEVTGLFPVSSTVEGAFVISLFDITENEENREPVLSVIEQFQEPATTAYSSIVQAGRVQPGFGITSWFEVGRVFPFFIQSPFSGTRELEVFTRLVQADAVEKIKLGFSSLSEDDLLWIDKKTLQIEQVVKGYREAIDDRKECFELSIQLGMFVAMADGSLDDPEGTVLKNWMTKIVTPFNDEEKKDLKSRLNETMKEAYHRVQEQTLSKSEIIERFNEMAKMHQNLKPWSFAMTLWPLTEWLIQKK